jgi:hypothetical protein
MIKHLLVAGAVVVLAAARFPARAGDAAPALPVAAWSRGAIDLEDLRGQPVAIVFYDDSTY